MAMAVLQVSDLNPVRPAGNVPDVSRDPRLTSSTSARGFTPEIRCNHYKRHNNLLRRKIHKEKKFNRPRRSRLARPLPAPDNARALRRNDFG
jgi:hypothetical protein